MSMSEINNWLLWTKVDELMVNSVILFFPGQFFLNVFVVSDKTDVRKCNKNCFRLFKMKEHYGVKQLCEVIL